MKGFDEVVCGDSERCGKMPHLRRGGIPASPEIVKSFRSLLAEARALSKENFQSVAAIAKMVEGRRMQVEVEKAGGVVGCLRETVRRFPGRSAVSGASRTITYRELWRAAGERVEGWRLKVGQRSLVVARASVDFAVAVIGTSLAGRVLVPYAKEAPEGVVRRIKRETDQIPMSTSPSTSTSPLFSSPVANILCTSGTTGAAKGVMLSHRAVWLAADFHCKTGRSDETKVCLIASPRDHIGGVRK